MYPQYSSFGAVSWFKTQQRFGHILDKVSPGRRQDSNFTNFTSLLDTSLLRLRDSVGFGRSGAGVEVMLQGVLGLRSCRGW